MFCANCGFQFEGNFCPQCGAKTVASREEKTFTLQAPQTGVYTCAIPSCAVYVGKDSVRIEKNCKEKGNTYRTNVTVPYEDITSVFYDDRGKRKISTLCIRSKDCSDLPSTADSSFCLSDPYCAVFEAKDKTAAESLFSFLKSAAEKNAYQIPLPIGPLKSFSFLSFANAHGLTESAPSYKAAEPITAQQRIRENRKNAVACCPKCGSTSLSANKKGFGVGKAAAGAFVTGSAYGFVAGSLGANKVLVTCLNCGHQWKL